jgi:hypothetical protein
MKIFNAIPLAARRQTPSEGEGTLSGVFLNQLATVGKSFH